MSIIKTALLIAAAILGTAIVMMAAILCPFAFVRRPRRHDKAAGSIVALENACTDSAPWEAIASQGGSWCAAA
jgi:hypothetical protein